MTKLDMMKIFAELNDDNITIVEKTVTGDGAGVKEVDFQPAPGKKFVLLGVGSYNTNDTVSTDAMVYITNDTVSCPMSSPWELGALTGAPEGDSMVMRNLWGGSFVILTNSYYITMAFGVDSSSKIANTKTRKACFYGFYLPDMGSSA